MIKVTSMRFTYPGNREETIKGLDFTINEGEIFGFLGPSGAGKSTTQKILIGMLHNYQGSVRVGGDEINRAGASFYEKIGVAFEYPNFYAKLTALENLNLFGSFYTSRTLNPSELLALVGLEQDADTRVANFSKGMKVRLNFCRALLNQPEIIFLDEPTSGLDPVNAKNLKNLILEQKSKGKTIFLTTHNMNTAEELCDRVAFIIDGQIALIDSPRNLKVERSKKRVRVEYRTGTKIKTEEFDLDGIGLKEDFLRILKEGQIETLHTLEASLEDIFIEVTGRTLT